MRAALAMLAVALAAACATGPDLAPKSGVPVDAASVFYNGVTFAAGDHVRIKSAAGTFKPKDTGYPIEIRAEPGRTGIVLGGMRRADSINQADPIQVVLIRFDPQIWRETSSSGAEVSIPTFEATIHADYVELVK